MRSQKNTQPADTKETWGNGKKDSNSPTVTVTRKHQPGKEVPVGKQSGGYK